MGKERHPAEPTGEQPSDQLQKLLVIDDLERARVLSDPLRIRILELLVDKAMTTKQVAERLREAPTRLYHHVGALEKAELIRLVEERPKRGTTEKYYRAVARSFRASSDLFAAGDDEEGGAADLARIGAAALETAAADLRRLTGARGNEREQGVLAYLEVRGDEAKLKALERRVARLLEDVQELAGESPNEDSEDQITRRVVLAWFPAPDSN